MVHSWICNHFRQWNGLWNIASAAESKIFFSIHIFQRFSVILNLVEKNVFEMNTLCFYDSHLWISSKYKNVFQTVKGFLHDFFCISTFINLTTDIFFFKIFTELYWNIASQEFNFKHFKQQWVIKTKLIIQEFFNEYSTITSTFLRTKLHAATQTKCKASFTLNEIDSE